MVVGFYNFADEIQVSLIGEKFCEKAEYSGYYETSDLSPDEEGYVECNGVECKIVYKGDTYNYDCEFELVEEYYE